MFRLACWWLVWWLIVSTITLAAYRFAMPHRRFYLAFVGVWLLWPVSRQCAKALVEFCREDLRGSQAWQRRLGNTAILGLTEARLRMALCTCIWWGVVVLGGAFALQLHAMPQRIVVSVGSILILALATHIRGHAAVDLYRAAATAAARRRVGAGE